MSLSLVVAVSSNNIIGHNGDLPWGRSLKADLRRFKAITMGHPILMGRKTWDSLGRALPGRTNIIISRQNLKVPDGVHVVASLEQALQVAAAAPGGEEVMLMGGGQLYAAGLVLANRVYLTRVLQDFEGDVSFPVLQPADWAAIGRTRGQEGDLAFEFLTLQRSKKI